MRRSLVAALLAAALPCAAQGKQITLEALLSAPFPDGLVAAPTGGVVAWTFDEGGSRNVWIARPPDYKASRITSYRGDDGQEITDLTFTPDGNAIAYVRGSSANAHGEIPNPVLDVAGETQAVWLVQLTGGAPRRIGDGRAPAISASGDRIAFEKSGQIWGASLHDTLPATQLMHTRGRARELRWSPKGDKLAFVSAREDHNFIGVYDAATKTLEYLSPSVDWDSSPIWSPDGAHVAFIRTPTTSRRPSFGAIREESPWSIVIADVATGAGHEIWKAKAGVGSAFRDIVADAQLMWAQGDRIIFPWERDGWTHLYAVSASGGEATLLTPGNFEVEHVSIAPDRATLLYSSNQSDIDRRHIWRVNAAGGKPAAVTTGTGIEWSPVQTSDGKAVAILRSDAKLPARPALIAGSAAPRDIAPELIPASFPASALVTPQQVIFPSGDGMLLHGQLFLPPAGAKGERHPAVVFFHGGSRRQMLLGWHYMYYYNNSYAMNQFLASRGFVVLAVNYRSGIGYGLNFREALDYGATGGSEYNDVQGAGLFLRARADVDSSRIGAWGGSYGGYLTALALARSSDIFSAGVDMHGVHDWNLEWETFVPGWRILKDQEARRTAFLSSPMAYESTWRSPVLLIQGDDDRNVAFSQTVQLAEDLRKQGVDVEQLIFPDEVHDFLLHRNWLAAYTASFDFLTRKLVHKSAAR
ncbi:MAG TPA: prolyl oligopeptidase family serine peptidase [Gemmatimonadaceae bacterium]|nr:prolyl oligopeptidase family serine peptidase [Gemmatimonadaceae bacterium]